MNSIRNQWTTSDTHESIPYKITRQKRIDTILGVDDWFLVEMSDHAFNSLYDNHFWVTFGCRIWETNYRIVINGNISLTQKTVKYPDRTHPFLKKGIQLRDIIRDDIHPEMNFTLYNVDTQAIIRTNPEFWKQFRYRIPSTHPLSLIPTF